ncbi:MAG: RidA family protein [Planctomycetota bacterium]
MTVGVRFVNPDDLPVPVGYSHAAIGQGRPVVLAGQVGCDATGRIEHPDDLVPQFSKALDNLLAALRAAGGAPTDVALLRIFTTQVETYRRSLKPLGAAYRERFGRHYPAMCLIGVTELFAPGSVVEIEGLAYVE